MLWDRHSEEYDVFSQGFPFIGEPTQQLTSNLNSAGTRVIIKSIMNTYGEVCSAQPAAYGYLEKRVITRSDLNGNPFPTTTTTYTLDTMGPQFGGYCPTSSWGNFVQVTTATSDGYAKTTTSQFYATDTSNWILGRLQQATVSATSPSQGTPVVRTSSFAYFGYGAPLSGGARGLLQEEITEPTADGGQDALESQYVYDAFGNKTGSTVSG